MFSNYGKLLKVLALAAALVTAAACGGKKAEVEDPAAAAAPKGPDYQLFAPLPKATTLAEVPYLLDEDGVAHTPCFQQVEGLAAEEAPFEVRAATEENTDAVREALVNWFIEDLDVTSLSEAAASLWELTIEDPVVVQVPMGNLRFVEDPQCIQPGTGWLSKDVRAVTTMIGARVFNFKSTAGVGVDQQEEMMQGVGTENIVLESEALFNYEPALDENDEPMKNEADEILFKAPDGTLIPEKEVPAPEQRLMKEWTLRAENPVFFAFQEISDEAWRKESEKDHCDVFLVWGDVTPRPPECEEFTESAFSATQEDDGVAITITTGGENQGTVLEFGKAEMLQINDRILLWISPKKIEEGVLLRLNSLVLNPQGVSAVAPTEAAEENYVPEKEDEPKKKKKGRKQSDQDALDSFLND